jgi:hypothetical protein
LSGAVLPSGGTVVDGTEMVVVTAVLGVGAAFVVSTEVVVDAVGARVVLVVLGVVAPAVR